MKKSTIRIKALQKEVDLKTKHLSEVIKLRSQLSDIAINKAETAMTERQESSNGKYELMKEQAARFATKEDLKGVSAQMNILQRIIWIGLGGLMVFELLSKYIKF